MTFTQMLSLGSVCCPVCGLFHSNMYWLHHHLMHFHGLASIPAKHFVQKLCLGLPLPAGAVHFGKVAQKEVQPRVLLILDEVVESEYIPGDLFDKRVPLVSRGSGNEYKHFHGSSSSSLHTGGEFLRWLSRKESNKNKVL